MSIIQASNLPASVIGAAGSYIFSSVLTIPAGVIDRVIKVRLGGSFLLGSGSPFGRISVNAMIQNSDGSFGNSLLSGSYALDQDSPSVLQFRGAASLAAIPFAGNYLDASTVQAYLPNLGPVERSSFCIGETTPSLATQPASGVVMAGPLGNGVLTFGSPLPLVVAIAFANETGLPNNSLGPIAASLAEFALEY